MDFRASAEGKYGRASAGASLHSELLKATSRTSISLQGIVSGVLNAPPVFVESTSVDKKTAKITASDRLADALIKFFDEFEEQFKQGNEIDKDKGTPLLFETDELSNCVNAPNGTVDLSPLEELIDEACELDDIIDERLCAIDYMRDFACQWNPQVDINQLGQDRDKLLQLSEKLQHSVETIGKLTSTNPPPVLPFSRKDIPETPSNWTLRKLRPVLEFRKVISNRTFTYEQQLPQFFNGQPAEFELTLRHISHHLLIGALSTGELVLESVAGRSETVFPKMEFALPGDRLQIQRITIPISSELKKLKLNLFSRKSIFHAILVLKM
jgi:hypothetical protein